MVKIEQKWRETNLVAGAQQKAFWDLQAEANTGRKLGWQICCEAS